jgi:guanyl-specific ribonuclease Sa
MCGWNEFQRRTGHLFRGPNHRQAAAAKDRETHQTLQRIVAGIAHPHRNDGGIFYNRQNLLPPTYVGYYHEYVHQLQPFVANPGAERIVIGAANEVYFTHDHYRIFVDLT